MCLKLACTVMMLILVMMVNGSAGCSMPILVYCAYQYMLLASMHTPCNKQVEMLSRYRHLLKVCLAFCCYLWTYNSTDWSEQVAAMGMLTVWHKVHCKDASQL